MALTLEKLLENSTPPPFEPPNYDGPTIKMREVMLIASAMGVEQNLWAVPTKRNTYPVKVSPYTLGAEAPLSWNYLGRLDDDYYLCSKIPQGGYKLVYAVFVPFDRFSAPYTNNLLMYVNGQFISRKASALQPTRLEDRCGIFYNKLQHLFKLLPALPKDRSFLLTPQKQGLPSIEVDEQTEQHTPFALRSEEYCLQEGTQETGFRPAGQLRVSAANINAALRDRHYLEDPAVFNYGEIFWHVLRDFRKAEGLS